MSMTPEEIFREELSELLRLGKTQENKLTSEQILEGFANSNIDESKISLIYDFLAQSNIVVDDDYNPEEAMTTEDKDFLSMFMEELEALPELSDAEKEKVILEAINEDEKAQMKVMEIFLPKVVEIAKLYVGQGVLLEDLIGEGNLALTTGAFALSCMDDPKEVDGFLAGMIMDAMEVLVSEETSVKSVDEKILEQVNRVALASEELYKELRRKVTPEELANETDLTEEEIREAYRLSGKQIDTLDVPESKEE